MNTTELFEIAKECGFTTHNIAGETRLHCWPFALQQFVQRIEQPHLQRIAELEKTCNILATNYDAARQASQFSAVVADDLFADLKHAKQQIEQLREVLQLMVDTHEEGGWPSATVVVARKALEEVLYARTDKSESMARAAMAKARGEQ